MGCSSSRPQEVENDDSPLSLAAVNLAPASAAKLNPDIIEGLEDFLKAAKCEKWLSAATAWCVDQSAETLYDLLQCNAETHSAFIASLRLPNVKRQLLEQQLTKQLDKQEALGAAARGGSTRAIAQFAKQKSRSFEIPSPSDSPAATDHSPPIQTTTKSSGEEHESSSNVVNASAAAARSIPQLDSSEAPTLQAHHGSSGAFTHGSTILPSVCHTHHEN